MIVTCPRCFATYNVPDTLLAAAPRKVRCSDCRFEWQESPPPQEAIAALAPEPLPQSIDEFAPHSQPQPPPMELLPEPVPPAPKPVRRDPRKTQAPAKDYTNAALWSLFLIVTFICAVVLLRDVIGKSAPVITDFYERIGLPVEGPEDWFAFKGIVLEKTEADGQTVLIVRGQVHNQSRRMRTVPGLRLFWREKGGNIGPVSILQARPEQLAPGENARFSGDLVGVDASAGGEVKVTFVSAKDAPPTALASKPATTEKSAPVTSEHTAPHEEPHAPAEATSGH